VDLAEFCGVLSDADLWDDRGVRAFGQQLINWL